MQCNDIFRMQTFSQYIRQMLRGYRYLLHFRCTRLFSADCAQKTQHRSLTLSSRVPGLINSFMLYNVRLKHDTGFMYCCSILKYLNTHFSLVRDALNYTSTPDRILLYHTPVKYFELLGKVKLVKSRAARWLEFAFCCSGVQTYTHRTDSWVCRGDQWFNL